jgi:DNA polymerase III alpha subunit
MKTMQHSILFTAMQEFQMMELLMDVAGFTLGEGNNARKIVGKKQMDKIPELREQVYG